MLATIVLRFSGTLENDSCGVLYAVYVRKLLKNSEGNLELKGRIHFLVHPREGCIQLSVVPKRVDLGAMLCTRSGGDERQNMSYPQITRYLVAC